MKPNTIAELFAIGLKITYTGDMANTFGRGAIVELEPANDWGGPYARIILDDGRDMLRKDVRHMRPASERDGCRHRLLIEDGYLDEAGIANLFVAAAMRKARESAAAQEAAAAYTAEVERIKAAYPQLEQGQSSKVAAKNIRKLLKPAFPGVKFSVTCDHNSIRVCWTDGPTGESVEAITNQFSPGHFDGQTDCYEYACSAWSDTFGDAKYIFCNRDQSLAFITATIASLAGCHDGELPTAEDYKQGRLYGVCPSRHCDHWQDLIYRAMVVRAAL